MAVGRLHGSETSVGRAGEDLVRERVNAAGVIFGYIRASHDATSHLRTYVLGSDMRGEFLSVSSPT